ncbi:4Fe-4S binding domain protein, partial [Vibrio cholerae HC-80A1]
QSR